MAKFQKKLNDQTRSCREDPNFVYFSIVGQSFLPQDIIEKLHKIGSLISAAHGKIWFGHSISFEILL